MDPTRRGFCAKENNPNMDRISLEETKASLMESNEEFRTIVQKHAEYKKLIEEIEAKPHPTPTDEIEEHRLKKLKLHLKDQIHEILSRYRAETEVA
jgi:uncharacterized protein YdcH (DUF465 family)